MVCIWYDKHTVFANLTAHAKCDNFTLGNVDTRKYANYPNLLGLSEYVGIVNH